MAGSGGHTSHNQGSGIGREAHFIRRTVGRKAGNELESLMIAAAPDLHDSNRKLHGFLEKVSNASNCAPAGLSSDLAAILGELLRVGEWLREGIADKGNTALQKEISEYRGNVERLRQLLPAVHRRLLAERARLESERAHLEAASAWAHASRQA
jgi:hypothetical protein